MEAEKDAEIEGDNAFVFFIGEIGQQLQFPETSRRF